MLFNSAEEMRNLICGDVDLYNKNTMTYIFRYNELDSICMYRNIGWDEAVRLQKNCNDDFNYWGAYLGWQRSSIIDSKEWIREHLMECNVDEDEIAERLPKYYSAEDFFEEAYSEDGWMLCTDVKGE